MCASFLSLILSFIFVVVENVFVSFTIPLCDCECNEFCKKNKNLNCTPEQNRYYMGIEWKKKTKKKNNNNKNSLYSYAERKTCVARTRDFQLIKCTWETKQQHIHTIIQSKYLRIHTHKHFFPLTNEVSDRVGVIIFARWHCVFIGIVVDAATNAFSASFSNWFSAHTHTYTHEIERKTRVHRIEWQLNGM